MPSLLERLDRTPPVICRCLARRDGRALTSAELAKATGLTEHWINRLSRRKSWAGIKIVVADKLLAACGVDPFNLKRQLEYLRRQKKAKRIFRHTWRHESYFENLLKSTE